MEKYDVVIAGSGMGGLVCGDILSREGYNVCVVEKNRQIGGCLQTFSRDKVIFDSGVHYIGSMEKGQSLYQLFRYLGLMDKLRLQKMDEEVFDKIIIENDPNEYIYAQGYDNFIAKLLEHFPGEEKALQLYCSKIQEICGKFPMYNLRSGGGYNEKADVLEIDTRGFIESITSNKKLQAVLAGNNALYAGEPNRTPFYVHALILNSYIEGSWKCVDGGSQIAKYMARNIMDAGGKVIRNAAVKKFVEHDGRIDHVELHDQQKIYGDYFISNIHPVKTLDMIESELIKNVYRKRLNSLQNTVSSFTVNIVLKARSFKYFKHNYYYHKEGHIWNMENYTEENWPLGYAMFLSASSRSPEYAQAMTILSYMRFEEVEQWKDSFNTVSETEDRGTDYDAFKKRKAEKMIDLAEEKFPGLRSHIHSYYTASPLSYRDYIGNDDGSMYGISKDYKDPLRTFISPRTKIPNLYLTGQNLNLHGVLGAAMSGMVTCTALMENDSIIEKIRNA